MAAKLGIEAYDIDQKSKDINNRIYICSSDSAINTIFVEQNLWQFNRQISEQENICNH